MAASRAQLVQELINPTLAKGQHVVTDRYIASSLAYQGYASGLPIDEVLHLSLFATKELTPDLTILIDLPVEESLKRRGKVRTDLNKKTLISIKELEKDI